MSGDRYLKLVLTGMAVALAGLSVAWLEQASANPGSAPEPIGPQAGSSAEPAAGALIASAGVRSPAGPAAPSAAVAPSTLPLRWRIPFARHRNETAEGKMDCATAVSVMKLGADPVQVDVEFFRSSGAPVGDASITLGTGQQSGMLTTNDDVSLVPFFSSADADTVEFFGHALVFADDPRVLVGAYLICHQEAGFENFPATVNELAAFPVGQTFTLFQAGMLEPMTMPPVTDAGS